MVDSIRIFSKIELKHLKTEKWKKEVDKETGVINYYYIFIGRVRIAYYPDSRSISLSGRYINSMIKDRTKNFDDLFNSQQEIIEFFKEFESKVNSYFKFPCINIFKEKVTRIDYTFNLTSKYSSFYIRFFNMYYKENRETVFKSYTNHTIEHGLNEESSFYLKPRKQYEKNLNQNFTLNFYSKQQQLLNTAKKEIEDHFYTSITEEDIKNSQDILRLEVQVHYFKLKSICKKNGIDWKTRSLSDLFDIQIARDTVCGEIKRFFGESNFHSYEHAKAIIKSSNKRNKKALIEYMQKIAKRNHVDIYSNAPKHLKELDIFPKAVIPKDWGIDELENPIRLIDSKIADNNLSGLTLKKGGDMYD